MSTSIFLLGVTGYIGGNILHLLLHRKSEFSVTALVRTESKIAALESLGVKVVKGSLTDSDIIRKLAYQADVTINTADCDHLDSAKAIAEGILQKFADTGKKAIYLHTSGSAAVFEDTQGNSASVTKYDDSNEQQIKDVPAINPHRHVDTYLLSTLSSFPLIIVTPSMVYGVGEDVNGIANRLTIVLPILVNAAAKKKQFFQIGKGLNIWSIVSIKDTAEFYLVVLDKLLKGELKEDQFGYYFLENGEVQYSVISQELAKGLHKRGVIPSPEVQEVNGAENANQAFDFPFAMFFGTNSRVIASKARKIGWNPKYQDFDYTKYLDEELDIALTREKK